MRAWSLPGWTVLILGLSSAAVAGKEAPLIEAAKTGQTQTVRLLTQQRVDLNATEVDGTTALHWAAYRDNLEIADALIRAGAAVNAVLHGNAYGGGAARSLTGDPVA